MPSRGLPVARSRVLELRMRRARAEIKDFTLMKSAVLY